MPSTPHNVPIPTSSSLPPYSFPRRDSRFPNQNPRKAADTAHLKAVRRATVLLTAASAFNLLNAREEVQHALTYALQALSAREKAVQAAAADLKQEDDPLAVLHILEKMGARHGTSRKALSDIIVGAMSYH
ncbi:hypothetical protein IAT38_001208 [Cryptococcus sp. DSM 104549]